MIELVSKKEVWRKRSKRMNYTDKNLEYRRHEHPQFSLSLRASISEGRSCASDGPFSEKSVAKCESTLIPRLLVSTDFVRIQNMKVKRCRLSAPVVEK